jgi:activator of HSP90 ATPase
LRWSPLVTGASFCLRLPVLELPVDNFYMEKIRQDVIIDCPAHAVYEAFLNEDQHADFTGSNASIEPKVGGIYSAYDDDLSGEFMRLVPDQLIVMQWKSNMPGWPEEHFATVEMELFQSSDGTTVELNIVDVPAELAAEIEAGWREYYWEPLQRWCAW